MATGNAWDTSVYIPQHIQEKWYSPLPAPINVTSKATRYIFFSSFTLFILMGYKCIWGKGLWMCVYTHRSYIQPCIKCVHRGRKWIYLFLYSDTHTSLLIRQEKGGGDCRILYIYIYNTLESDWLKTRYSIPLLFLSDIVFDLFKIHRQRHRMSAYLGLVSFITI